MFGLSVRLGLEQLNDRNAPSSLPGTLDPIIADPNQTNSGVPAYVGLPPGGPTEPSIPNPVDPNVVVPQAKPNIWLFAAKPVDNTMQNFEVSGWMMCTDGFFGPGKVAIESNVDAFDGLNLIADNNGYFESVKPFNGPAFTGTYWATPTQNAGNIVGDQQFTIYFFN